MISLISPPIPIIRISYWSNSSDPRPTLQINMSQKSAFSNPQISPSRLLFTQITPHKSIHTASNYNSIQSHTPTQSFNHIRCNSITSNSYPSPANIKPRYHDSHNSKDNSNRRISRLGSEYHLRIRSLHLFFIPYPSFLYMHLIIIPPTYPDTFAH